MHDRSRDLRGDLRRLECEHGGRLGVAILDTENTESIAYRGDERFAMCSTFKFLAAAFVLARVDRKRESLTRRVIFGEDCLVPYSPITEKRSGAPGMTIGEICDSALTFSDNTAGNLLLDSFGGPMELTAFIRTLGDAVTRCDRREPELNEVRPGDPRDTTTPLAMLELVREIVLGDVLVPSSREQMMRWLLANETGDRRLRAAVPQGWKVGDKTGTTGITSSDANNATNDIAVIWPPARAPIVVTAYYVETGASYGERESVLAEIGRLAISKTR
jgi:beta-lactamase class A